jgi:PilZ domain
MRELSDFSGLSGSFKPRKYRRFNLHYPVLVKFQRGRFTTEIEATSKNVSVGGLLLQAASEIPQHTPIRFTMTIQGGPVVRPIRITGEGKVVRVEHGSREREFAIAVQCLSRVTQIRQCLPAAS